MTHIACTPELQKQKHKINYLAETQLERKMTYTQRSRKHAVVTLPTIPEETPDELEDELKDELNCELNESAAVGSDVSTDDVVDIFFEEGDSVLGWVYVKDPEEFERYERVARWNNKRLLF